MTRKEKDRIECAIRHIQTAIDVDPWAQEIAMEAMNKRLPEIRELLEAQPKVIACGEGELSAEPECMNVNMQVEKLSKHQSDFSDLDAESERKDEIVRCKDCKHSEHWYRDKARCFLWEEYGIDVWEDGFCNYAERREK